MLLLALGQIFLLIGSYASAQESICAQVKIEILEELTLEREAFEERMTINNGLTGVSLDQISVDVTFADRFGAIVRATSDPNDLTAKFFIRLQDGSCISAHIPGGLSSSLNCRMIPAASDSRADTEDTLGISFFKYPVAADVRRLKLQ